MKDNFKFNIVIRHTSYFYKIIINKLILKKNLIILIINIQELINIRIYIFLIYITKKKKII